MALVPVYSCVVLLVFCSINKHKHMVFCTTFCNVYASNLRQCGLGKVVIHKVGFYSSSLINVQS
jgi:hypothetical protein